MQQISNERTEETKWLQASKEEDAVTARLREKQENPDRDDGSGEVIVRKDDQTIESLHVIRFQIIL